jgi:hypothetical protein
MANPRLETNNQVGSSTVTGAKVGLGVGGGLAAGSAVVGDVMMSRKLKKVSKRSPSGAAFLRSIRSMRRAMIAPVIAVGALAGTGIGAGAGALVGLNKKNKQISKKAEYVFEKVAKILDLSDVENKLDYYFPDEEEEDIRERIKDQYSKRLGLRHPILTGLPTLGIWPAQSKFFAVGEITRGLFKKDKDLQRHYQGVQARRTQTEDFKRLGYAIDPMENRMARAKRLVE